MKTKRLLCMLLISVLALAGLVFAACAPDTQEDIIPEGPETGVYYLEEDGQEHLITLNSGNKFALLVRDVNKSGTYTLAQDGTLTLNFYQLDKEEEPEVISATHDETFIRLTYLDKEMKFFKRIEYTVSFESSLGAKIDDIQVLNGKTVARPDMPELTGYSLIGWYAERNFITPFNFGTQRITKDTVIYAYWMVNDPAVSEYLVDFDLNMDAENPKQIQTLGGKILDMPKEPSRDGYKFKDWWVSFYDDAQMLSYKYEEGMVLQENTTLYAYWQAIPFGNDLDEPYLWVDGDAVAWEGITGANDYSLEITNKGQDTPIIAETVIDNRQQVNFSDLAAGDYLIKLTANAINSDDNSENTIYYKNKALSRVSHFAVVEPSVLSFNHIEGATNYIISLDVGDKFTNLIEFDNGRNTFFDFSGFNMPKGGIKFTVFASAPGRATSSRVYTFIRVLDEIEGFYLDKETETLYWDSVENSTSYIVSIFSGNSTQNHEYIDNGNKTSYSLKEHSSTEDGIEINVYAKAKGWNSPNPTVYNYAKTNLATPKNIRVEGRTISWDEVAGATSYEIKVGNDSKTIDQNSYVLPLDFELTSGTEYEITIRALGEQNSLWSNPAFLQDSLSDSLVYSSSVLTWNHVIGAERYEILVNNQLQTTVDGGVNNAEITLTKGGTNVLVVKAFVGGSYHSAFIEVYANTISLEMGGGDGLEQYYASGDKINLPSAVLKGYEFGGWYTFVGAGRSLYADKHFSHNSDITLHAKWLAKKFDVSFEYDGGIGSGSNTNIEFGQEFELEVPTTEDGRLFGGWYTKAGGTGQNITDGFGRGRNAWDIAEDSTLYAFWVEALKYHLIEFQGSPLGWLITKTPHIDRLTSVSIPETYQGELDTALPIVEINAHAFVDCYWIERISIPSGVYDIGENAFGGCSSLTEVQVAPFNRHFRSKDGVLYGLDEETGIENSLAFYPLAKAGEFIVPNTITKIEIATFAGRNYLTKVTLPATIEIISDNAFSGCISLKNVIFESGITSLTIGKDAFASCILLEEIEIPRGTTVIGTNAFQNCSSLTQINIPNTITDIGNYAFADCTSLKVANLETGGQEPLTIGTGTTGAYIFRNCFSLTTINIPNRVTVLGNYAFSGCRSLTSVDFEEGGTEPLVIGIIVASGSTKTHVFANCISLESIEIPGRTADIGNYAFSGCRALKEVIFREGTIDLRIGTGNATGTTSTQVFQNCTALTSIEIPGRTVYLGGTAFNTCYNLTTVTFEAGEKELLWGANLFNGAGITSITIPKRMTNFRNINIFSASLDLAEIQVEEGHTVYSTYKGVLYSQDMTTLMLAPRALAGDYTIPAGVQNINKDAFSGCLNLGAVSIPNTVTSIGDNAFRYSLMTGLTFVSGGEGSITLGTYAFADCTGLTSVTISDRISTLSNYTFYGCINLKTVNISASVTSIGNNAFALTGVESFVVSADNQKFSSDDGVIYEVDDTEKTLVAFPTGKIGHFTLPEGITSIGAYAFARAQISSITLPSTLKIIGSNSFNNCTNLKSIVIPAGVTTFEGSAFANSGLEAMTFEEGQASQLSEIGNNCFQSSAMKGFVIPASVTKIGQSMFLNAKSFSWLEIEDGELPLSIGNSSFRGTILSGNITIPARVTSLGNTVFRYAPITSVTFEDNSNINTFGSVFKDCEELTKVSFGDNSSLVSLGASAFENCISLTTVDFGLENSLETIEQKAFLNSGVTSIHIPKNVTSIGNYAFQFTPITMVTFEEGGIENLTLDTTVFSDCVDLVTVNLSSRLIKIGNNSFKNCVKLSTLTFGEGTLMTGSNNIGSNAFEGCVSLRSLTLPVGANFSSANVFTNLIKLAEINVHPDSTHYSSENGILYNADKTSIVYVPMAKKGEYIVPQTVGSIGSAFNDCYLISKITLHEGITSISAGAFGGCSNLSEIVMPVNEKYTVVDGVLFDSAMTTLIAYPAGKVGDDYIVPNDVTTIGANAFDGTTALKNLALPENLTKINARAFRNSIALETVNIPQNITDIPTYAFYGCTALKTVDFTTISFLQKIGTYAFQYCTSLTSFDFPANLTSIGNTAFDGCTSLKSIVIPFGMKEITNFAFSNCASLESVSIPSSVTKIGSRSFENCTSLTSVVIPGSIETLDSSAFAGCVNLKEVSLSYGLIEIGQLVFSGCTSLEAIDIPISVATINNNAFENCTSLTSIVIPSSVQTFGNYVFAGCTNLKSVILSAGASTIGSYAFRDCTSLTSIDIPMGVEEISSYAFAGCTGLTNISLSESIMTIGTRAFSGCTNVTSITIPKNVSRINSSAFVGWTSDQTIYIPWASSAPDNWDENWDLGSDAIIVWAV